MHRYTIFRYSLSVLTAMLIIGGLMSCGKEEPVEFPDNWERAGSQCSNGQLDDGELQIDCGGTCPPCADVEPPCSVNLGTLQYHGGTYNISSVFVQTYGIIISAAGRTVNIVTGNPLIPNTEYNLTAANTPTGNTARVTLNDAGLIYNSQNNLGTFTVTGPSSSPTYVLCDAALLQPNFNNTRMAAFKADDN